MTSAIFGLLGVLLGSLLAGAKDWFFLHLNITRDAAFLSVQVVGKLDRYVLDCSSVVADDGFFQGRTDDDGYRFVQAKTPIFEIDALKVEWRAIPVKLMYEILDLPYKAIVAQHVVDGVRDNSVPPDFDEFFEERQLQYANLGLLAAGLASQLRKHVGLLPRCVDSKSWDPVKFMRGVESKILLLRTERERD